MNKTQLSVAAAVLSLAVGNTYGEGSGAAILKGLQKAESGQIDVKEAVTDGIVEKGMNESTRYVSHSFTCKYSGLVRQITIEYPSADAGYACRVLYDSEKESKTLWLAKHQKDYCEPQAVGLVTKHLEKGWECTEP